MADAPDAPSQDAQGGGRREPGTFLGRRFPPNLFSIPFGIAGLADVWAAARPILHNSIVVCNTLYIAAAALWAIIVVLYFGQGLRRMRTDARDPVLGPFVSLAVITPTLLSAVLAPYAFQAARVLVSIFIALTVIFAGWMTGQWVAAPLDVDAAHPGYFLPSAAGGFIAAFAAEGVHLHLLSEVMFGLGVLSWVLLGSLLLFRLFFRPMLPTALVPTLAIELAPPVVAGVAYYALSGGRTDTFAAGLAGYALLMGFVQLRFIPLYAKLHLSPATWAFGFTYAAAANDALFWIQARRPSGATAYAAVTVALTTILIGAIALFTASALVRGRFLPKPA